FLGPLILMIILFICCIFYIETKRSALFEKEIAIADRVNYTIDSLRQRDQEELNMIIEKKTADKRPRGEINRTRDLLKHKIYQPGHILTNIYGDTVTNSSLVKMRSLEYESAKLNGIENSLTREDGAIAITYLSILILIYPIRFL